MEEINVPVPVALLSKLAESFCHAYFYYQVTDNRFELLNPPCAELLGTTTAILHHNPKAFMDTIHPQDRDFVVAQYHKLVSDNSQPNKLEKIEFRVILPDQKRIRWISLAVQRFVEKDEVYIGGFLEDITQYKEYIYNILKFNAKKNATLEILSHDLAAPFANINGLSELLSHQVKENNGEIYKTLAHIKENAQRGSDMIRDFVDNEFLESSQVTLNKERIDIVMRIRVLIDNYKQQQGMAKKRFELEVPSEPVFMYVDEMKFMQAINNLISNSIKFTLDNGCIKVKVEEQGRIICFAVIDDGVGIPTEVQPYVFEKFTKARRKGLRGEKSVGLGMSIIKNIVEWHNGKIWFESEVDKGTNVFIEMPKD